MQNEAVVTIRVPRELKQRVDEVAHDLSISQSAVWKILISRYIRPAMEGDLRSVLDAAAVQGGRIGEAERADAVRNAARR